MKKYWSIFKISFQQEFAYRLNFILWRVRNVLQIFLVFFLWDTIFSSPGRVVFGYDRAKILTYIFGILIIKAFVFSSRSVDVAAEISKGDLTNYLLKPISYFKYWLTRDLSSKALNLIFAVVEVSLLYLILRPPFFFQTNLITLLLFVISIFFAIFIFFTLLFILNLTPLWFPELGWGAQYLFIVVIIEFLSGSLFPIDILPFYIQKILYLLPFPYLVFFPLQIYLGKISGTMALSGFLVAFSWCILFWLLLNFLWNKGMKFYRAEGK